MSQKMQSKQNKRKLEKMTYFEWIALQHAIIDYGQ